MLDILRNGQPLALRATLEQRPAELGYTARPARLPPKGTSWSGRSKYHAVDSQTA